MIDLNRRLISLATLGLTVCGLTKSSRAIASSAAHCPIGEITTPNWNGYWNVHRAMVSTGFGQENPEKSGIEIFATDDTSGYLEAAGAFDWEEVLTFTISAKPDDYSSLVVEVDSIPIFFNTAKSRFRPKVVQQDGEAQVVGVSRWSREAETTLEANLAVRLRRGSLITSPQFVSFDGKDKYVESTFLLSSAQTKQLLAPGADKISVELLDDNDVVLSRDYISLGLEDTFLKTMEAHLRARNAANDIDACPKGGGCYLTTAACAVLRLPDNCWELRQLRKFRDEWLLSKTWGRADVDHYYQSAPAVVAALSRADDSHLIFTKLYWLYILPCALLFAIGCPRIVYMHYRNGVRSVSKLVRKRSSD
ncbi:CFI-box-CTERM domain-containing protein [Dokdonella sp.]|uniref:CFI-box-CTERM domain-containing protein n=1 Tax=Dokdonella sp. TaxID=2291710 RepID=UPI003528813F